MAMNMFWLNIQLFLTAGSDAWPLAPLSQCLLACWKHFERSKLESGSWREEFGIYLEEPPMSWLTNWFRQSRRLVFLVTKMIFFFIKKRSISPGIVSIMLPGTSNHYFSSSVAKTSTFCGHQFGLRGLRSSRGVAASWADLLDRFPNFW